MLFEIIAWALVLGFSLAGLISKNWIYYVAPLVIALVMLALVVTHSLR